MSNLLTPEEHRLVKREYRLRVVAVALTFLFFTVVFGIAELLPSYFYSSVSRTLAEDELEKLQGTSDIDDTITNALEDTAIVLTFLKEKEGEEVRATDVIKEALAALPPAVAIERLSFESAGEEKVLAIAGVAATRADLITYADALGNRPSFLSTDIPAENLAQTRDISFTIRVAGSF